MPHYYFTFSGRERERFEVQCDTVDEARNEAVRRLGQYLAEHPGFADEGVKGGDRAAFMYSLIVTARLNDIDPQSWLADVLARIADMPQGRLDELLPWNWRSYKSEVIAQAA